ncbi:putative dehydrogenase [Motilibacter rhizosphaerae]|uniref:Putative dehydrogenase n=1 Tax=Motilibacter rhizosphaerae TaxID=598652 RepID=A0A4Q7NSE5_9ACTN|nr:Gfo/Idh/MocA family oxidoreductase [Motilibacter rhizosphaerae]RZS87580.1 putative dehydrogenase [Motilibacter rhizosphaerae]
MTFRRVPSSPSDPLRVVVVGAGAMGRGWLRTVLADDGVALAGVVDLDVAAARAGVADVGQPDLPVGTDLLALAARTGAQAVVDVTVPGAHHAVTTQALRGGLPVLGEKPAAETVARTLSLAAAAELTGELFMVSQNRRWNPHLAALRAARAALGEVVLLRTDFYRAPRFGGFREQMRHPLLVDMAIHAFDSARWVTGDEPVAVTCTSWNPAGSWYAGDACAAATFELAGGGRYAYTGSWCSPGRETSWNGEWELRGTLGSASWDGESAPVVSDGVEVRAAEPLPGSDLAGSLRTFVEALRTGVAPSGEVHENVLSLAMVEAAVLSADRGERLLLDDVLDEAHATAVGEEGDPEVREVLRSWTSARSALAL